MQATNLVLYYAVLRECSVASSEQGDTKNKNKQTQKQKGENAPTLVTKEWLNAQKQDGLPSVCFHWYRLGNCAYGPLCKFRHPPDMAAKEQKERGIVLDEPEKEISSDQSQEYDMKTIAAERRKLFAK